MMMVPITNLLVSVLNKGIVASAMVLTSLVTVVMSKGIVVSAIVTTIAANTTIIAINKGIVVSTIVILPTLVLRWVQRL